MLCQNISISKKSINEYSSSVSAFEQDVLVGFICSNIPEQCTRSFSQVQTISLNTDL